MVVLRQSVGAGDPGAVYKLAGGGSWGDAARADYVLGGGREKLPLVRDTLLCDRFVLVDGRLKPVLEARSTQLPELLPHAVEIIGYLGRYFGIDD
ncbi:hypothetical protein ACIRBY_28955 [Streptomyces sp. NPDC096136]|uniref:hypothetical protein n=1 Tax=Streptomyces sp. NPDC096136 TaxID=3366076 RepID=UPI0037FA65CE